MIYAGEGRSGLKLESHLSQGAIPVPSWRPPALPPKPRQKLQGILSVFLALFLRHHMPAADFPLLVAPCTGGAMLTLVTWICSNTMPGKGKASSPQLKTSLQLTLSTQEIRLFLSVHEIVLHVEMQNISFLSPLT